MASPAGDAGGAASSANQVSPSRAAPAADSHKCSVCASCCSAGAILNPLPHVPEPEIATTVFAAVPAAVDVFAVDGPDRPPRALLANRCSSQRRDAAALAADVARRLQAGDLARTDFNQAKAAEQAARNERRRRGRPAPPACAAGLCGADGLATAACRISCWPSDGRLRPSCSRRSARWPGHWSASAWPWTPRACWPRPSASAKSTWPRAANENVVWVHASAERFSARQVQVLDATRSVVTAGLAAGDRVVTLGATLLAQIR